MRNVKISSWNVLADKFAHHDRYPDVAKELLSKSFRYPLTVRTVCAFDSDVICLQEVDVKLFEHLSEALMPVGYEGDWAPMKSSMVGIATFVRQPFSLREVEPHRYTDGVGIVVPPTNVVGDPAHELPHSGHVCTVSLVRCGDGKRDPHIQIANTHLIWDDPSIAHNQRRAPREAAELLQLVRRRNQPAIVCGDFNSEPEREVPRTFTENGFHDAHNRLAVTFNRPERDTGLPRARKIDYILYGEPLRLALSSAGVLDDAMVLPSDLVPSDHVPLHATLLLPE